MSGQSINAWDGRAKERIYTAVKTRGYTSVTEFADNRPVATFFELAAELGEGIAPIQILWLLKDEAENAGKIRQFAISSFARRLRELVPEGWNRGPSFEFDSTHAYSCWASELDPKYTPDCKKVWRRLKTLPDIQNGWLPACADDPVLSRAFQDCFDEYNVN